MNDGAAGTASDAVRKQVTALFADLVGATAFGDRVDPEATRAALAPYFEILQTTIEAQSGTVVKFTGDGVFAVFGIPEVSEDDALRAVAAGCELQGRFGAFADQVRSRHGVELGLRVGINSGELVVGEDDADLVGDVLNTAARLEAACEPGRVMVGEETWRLTRSAVGYEVLGEINVKGKADAIATFQVVESDNAAIEKATPFVGRSKELGELVAAFEHADSSSTLQLVTIVGAPGVGKTRLASELRAAVPARSCDLRFERRGSTTFSPIADLLRSVGDGSAESVERLLADHPERDRLVPILQSFLGHGAARSTEESFWAVRRLLERLADEHGPQVIVVDDIQWAEPLFWDLLEHLVEWTAAPVLIVALARPELRELRPELARAGDRVASSLALAGLADSETRELAARLLDTDELPTALTDRLPSSTEGNPLFVSELVSMLVDDGTLVHRDSRWLLTIDADAIDVPPTIISLLASRVERLPEEERSIIELASVLGTEFDRGTLTALADSAPPQVHTLLDRLRRRDLIEPSVAWAGDHPLYRFHHVLVRDAAYRRLLKERRAELHERVGHHVAEQRSGGDGVDVIVAHHFEQAVMYRRELGIADGATAELAAQTVGLLRRAADNSLSLEDLTAAGAYAQRALALVESAAGARDELLLIGCEALLGSGDVAGATPLVAEVHERAADDRVAAWADCFRAQRWSLTDPDRLAEASEITDAAATRLDELDDPAGVAKARLVRASCLARLGRIGESEHELDLALGAARQAGDRRRTVAVLGAAPLAALWGPSPVPRAGGRCLDVLRLLRITTASPAVEATSIRCQGVLEALRGRPESAREKLEQSRATARELGLRQGLFETELFSGWVELWVGDALAAEPYLRTAHEGLGRLGIEADAGQAGALLARSLLLQGRIDEAGLLAVDAVESAGQNLQTAVASRSVLAEVRAAQGRIDEAEVLLREALDIAERTDIVLDHALALQAAGRVSGRSSLSDRAGALLANKGVTDGESGSDDQVPSERSPGSGTVQSGPDQSRPIGNAASALLDRFFQRFSSWDVEAMRRLVIDGFHHTIRVADAAVQDVVSFDDMMHQWELSYSWAPTIELTLLATRSVDLALIELAMDVDGFVTRRCIVTESNGLRLTNLIWFGPDQRQEAVDELDRRWAQRQLASSHEDNRNAAGTRSEEPTTPPALPELTNAAERLGRALLVALNDVDVDAFEALIHPEFEHLDRSLGAEATGLELFTVSDWVDSDPVATQRLGPGPALIGRRVLAVRGEHLALVEFVQTMDGNGVTCVALIESLEGRVRRTTVWQREERSQLTEALDELDRRFVDRGGDAGLADRFLRSRTAFATPGLDTGALPFADDFVTVDHRPIGAGAQRFAEFVESADSITPTTFVVPRIFDHVGDLTLYEVQFVRNADDVLSHVIHIAKAGADDLVHENHVFNLEQLDEARELFDDLVAGGAYSEQASERVLNVTSNTAWHVATRFGAFIRNEVSDRMTAMTHPEYVIVNHGRLESVTPDVDATGSADHYSETFTELGFTTRTELLAVRGEDLCLIRYDFRPDDWHIPRLLLFEQQDGMVRRADWYDIEQLDQAAAQLDRRWLGHLDRALEDTWAEFLATARRGVAGHVERWRHPFPYYDDRRAARAADPDAVLAASTGIVTQIHRLTARGIVYQRLDAETSASCVVIAVLGDRLAQRVELFEIDDLAVALDRFGDLGLDRPEPLTNDITRLSRRFAREWPRNMPQITTFCEPDFRIMVRRRSQPAATGGLQDFESWLQYWHDVGATVFHGDVIAIRGERHSLFRHCVRTANGDEEPLLIVTKLGTSGRWEHQITFDDEQMVDALDELDRTWGETDGKQLWAEVMLRWRAASISSDVVAIRALLTDDFVSIDHRAAGHDLRGPIDFIESLRPRVEQSRAIVPVVEELHRTSTSVALVTVTTHSPQSGDDTELLLLVDLDAAGRCRRSDIFNVDQWHQAIAQFEELTNTLES